MASAAQALEIYGTYLSVVHKAEKAQYQVISKLLQSNDAGNLYFLYLDLEKNHANALQFKVLICDFYVQ